LKYLVWFGRTTSFQCSLSLESYVLTPSCYAYSLLSRRTIIGCRVAGLTNTRTRELGKNLESIQFLPEVDNNLWIWVSTGSEKINLSNSIHVSQHAQRSRSIGHRKSRRVIFSGIPLRKRLNTFWSVVTKCLVLTIGGEQTVSATSHFHSIRVTYNENSNSNPQLSLLAFVVLLKEGFVLEIDEPLGLAEFTRYSLKHLMIRKRIQNRSQLTAGWPSNKNRRRHRRLKSPF